MQRWLGILAMLCLLGASGGAHAYCLQTVSGYSGYSAWKQQVPYYLSDSLADPQLRAAIKAAFASWNAVGCSTLQLTDGGSFSLATADFQSPGAGIYVFWYTDATSFPSQPDYVATTLFGIDGAGAIVQASIAVNAFNYAWATDGSASAFDAQGELTGLIGLVLGLAASNASSSVLHSGLKYGDTDKRVIKPDDEAGLGYLYPDPGCTPPAAPGSDGCAAPVGGGNTGGSTGCTTSADCADGEICSTEGNCVSIGGGGASGCTASSECPAGQVCTAEGTCITAAGAATSSGCSSFVECAAGEVCTAEGDCVPVGSGDPPADPADPPADPPSDPPASSGNTGGTNGGCTSSSECGANEVCSAEGVCVELGSWADSYSSEGEGGGGGGCSAGGAPRTPILLFLLGLALLSWRRARAS